MSVDATRGRVDWPVSTVSDDVDVDVNDVRQLDRLAQVESGLPLQGGGGASATGVDSGVFMVGGLVSAFLSGVDGYVDFAGDVVIGVASLVPPKG